MIVSRFTLSTPSFERTTKLVEGSTTTSGVSSGSLSTSKGITIANAAAIPSTNPASGGILYAEAGSLKWRSQAGTISTVANA